MTANVCFFGADNTGVIDASPAISDAIDFILSGRATTLEIPPGQYRFESQIVRTEIDVPINIKGESVGSTYLIGDNPDGLFNLSWQFNPGPNPFDVKQAYLSDMTCLANQVGSGTAFEFNFPNYQNLHLQSLNVERVNMLPMHTAGPEYWDYGIVSDNPWRPTFVDVKVGNAWGPGAQNLLSPKAGILIKGHCFTPTFRTCAVWGGEVGYQVADNEPDDNGEGASFYDCRAVENMIGILLSTSGSEPEFHIIGGHYNCTRTNIHLQNRRKGIVSGVVLYAGLNTPDTVTTHYDVLVEGCEDILITDNMFFNQTGPAIEYVGVELRQNGTGFQSVRNTVRDNTFKRRDIGVRTQPGTNSTYILDNRFDPNMVITDIVDNGSNSVIRRV